MCSFWAIIVQREIDRHKIQVIEGSDIAAIPMFHTSNVIVSDSLRFAFIRSIPETMLHNVTSSSEIIDEYRRLPASGPRPLTSEMQKVLEEADKPNKGAN